MASDRESADTVSSETRSSETRSSETRSSETRSSETEPPDPSPPEGSEPNRPDRDTAVSRAVGPRLPFLLLRWSVVAIHESSQEGVSLNQRGWIARGGG